MRTAFLSLLLILLSGCGEQSPTSALPVPDSCYDETYATQFQPYGFSILNGTFDASCQYKSIVFIHLALDDGDESICSGSLIAPNIVLGAAHCFVDSPSSLESTVMAGKAIVRVARTVIHPDYIPDVDTGTGLHDLALLFLEKSINLTPIKLSSVIPSAGTRVTNIGYGYDGLGLDGQGNSGRRLVGNQIVDSGYGTGRPSLDFADAIVTVAEKDEQNSCGGDSGGALIYEDRLVGVLSGGDYEFSTVCRTSVNSAFTPVPKYLHWIHQQTGL